MLGQFEEKFGDNRTHRLRWQLLTKYLYINKAELDNSRFLNAQCNTKSELSMGVFTIGTPILVGFWSTFQCMKLFGQLWLLIPQNEKQIYDLTNRFSCHWVYLDMNSMIYQPKIFHDIVSSVKSTSTRNKK